jgi:hypothetical protein
VPTSPSKFVTAFQVSEAGVPTTGLQGGVECNPQVTLTERCKIWVYVTVSSNSIPPCLRTTEPTSSRHSTVTATTANSAGAPPRSPAPVSCLDPRRHGSARTCSLHCTRLNCLQLALHAWRDPLRIRSGTVGRDTRSGQGALASRHTDGPLWAALLKTTVMCKAWRRCTTLLGIPLEPLQLQATSASPRTKSLIPIPVPVQYRLSRCCPGV